MDLLSIIRYACSLIGLLFLGFTYKNIFFNAKKKDLKLEEKETEKM